MRPTSSAPGRKVVITGMGIVSSIGLSCTQVLDQAGIDRKSLEGDERTGLIFGNDSSVVTGVEQCDILRQTAETRAIGSGHIFRLLNSTISLNICTKLRLCGSSWTVSGACASGAMAIGQAAELIASGRQDRIICGSAQEISWQSMCSFDGIGAFSTREESPTLASRPFDRDRDGLVPSGGAAAIFLEEEDSARDRGAPILAEILGYGTSSDGYHLSAPSGKGLESNAPCSPGCESTSRCHRSGYGQRRRNPGTRFALAGDQTMSLGRVVITGRGAVSPFGLGVDTLISNIWLGRSAVRKMHEWTGIKGLKSLIAAPVPDFDSKALLPRSMRRTMGQMALFATIAAREAAADAHLDQEMLSSGNTGVAIGSTTGSPQAYQNFYESFLPEMTMEQIKSGEFFKMMGHSCSANVCLALGIQGEQWAPASACASSAQALGLGYLLIKTGRQQVMLCGGSEEVEPTVTGVFDLIKAGSCRNDEPPRSPRPFDRDRDGVVCGSGSGILVLEDYMSAQKRGARIYAEILGFGNVNDHEHIANPHEKAMSRAMLNGMREAGVAPEEIDYVNAHATGTEQGDPAEAAAISHVLGEKTPVSSLKGHIGHTLGAAGSLELVILLEMLERQEIVPTLNLDNIDPTCHAVNLVQNRGGHSLQTVIKNNFALGGVNTSLVLRRAVS